MKDGNRPEVVSGKAGGRGSMAEFPEAAASFAEALEAVDAEDRRAAENRQRLEWVDTPSARQIDAALAAAQEYGEVAVIHGGTGVGKTAAAKRYAARFDDVWIAEMSPAANRLRPCLQQVAQALNLGYVAGGAHRIEIELANRMRRTGGLLVIDEAQHLGHPQLEELRHLHDGTGCGLALLGNDVFGARIGRPEFAALASRVGNRAHLPHVTTEDVDALLYAWGIDSAQAREEALRLVSPPGGVRVLARALQRGNLARGKRAARRTSTRGGAA